MKKIKDMAQDELERVVGQAVLRITEPLRQAMNQISEHFKEIEQKLQQKIVHPHAYKIHLMEEIARLSKDIDKFLDAARELKRKEEE